MMSRKLIGAATLLVLVGCSSPKPVVVPTNPPVVTTETPEAVSTEETIAATEVVAESTSSVPTATVEPFIPVLTQLTQPGCCVQPFWSIDGQTVLFIDKPDPEGDAAIYGVPITGGAAKVIYDKVALLSPDARYSAYRDEQGQTIVAPYNSEVTWTIPSGGGRVFFSPQSVRLAWATVPGSGNFDERPTTITVSDIDGSDPKEVATVYGGGIGGWLDDDHLLLVGRDRSGNPDLSLFSISVVDGTRTTIISNQRIRTVEIAPGGGWIMYTIMVNPDDPSSDGIWVIDATGKTRYKLAVTGSAHWRDATHLLIVPFEPDTGSNRIWEFDAITGTPYPITDPAVTPFKIANNDWSIAPDGMHLVLVGEDQSLWLMTLPPAGYGQ